MTDFVKSYSLSLKEALLVPCIESFILNQWGAALPWPTLTGLRDFVAYFGHSANAFRTAVSRSKKQGVVAVFQADDGTKRVQLGEAMLAYTQYFLADPFEGSCFSLILFQMATEQTQERYRLKETLNHLNYKMVTPNAYLRYGNHPEAVDHLLAQQNLSHYTYHFSGIQTLPTNLETRIPHLYQTSVWAKRLKTYQTALTAYLEAVPLPGPEAYTRYLYSRAAFHKNILTQAPYLPERFFPEVTLVKTIFQQLIHMAQTHAQENIETYKKLFDTP